LAPINKNGGNNERWWANGKMRQSPARPTQQVSAIEILGATLEEACLKKRDTFFQLISIVFCDGMRGFVDC
jgi:hypothetical protein